LEGPDHDAANVTRARQLLGGEQWDGLDEFDRAQLARVIDVCFRSRSLSEAGRALFNNSRKGGACAKLTENQASSHRQCFQPSLCERKMYARPYCCQ
jgi:sigma54-dependent transcription regulator